MKAHRDLDAFYGLYPSVRALQQLASNHGIDDIFQDNGGKLLQLLLVTGLRVIGGRQGNDAVDESGTEYELKTVNVAKRRSPTGRVLETKGVTTHHHLNPTIIAKYRKVTWVFGIYEGIDLQAVYVMLPHLLEPYFAKWEAELRTRNHLNNRKIPVRYVLERGQRVWVAELVPD